MKYEGPLYLWPPRPTQKIPPALLGQREKRGYWAQVKKEGTCNEISISPDRQITARTRHPNINKGLHKLWQPDEITRKPFLDLPGNGWYVFLSELLHSKVVGLRHINYIHDILVYDGEFLIGVTFEERQKLLAKLFPNAVESTQVGCLVIDANTWLARNYISDFWNLYQSLSNPEDEGLVLKFPSAKLEFCSREDSNSSWQVKCRRPTKVNHF